MKVYEAVWSVTSLAVAAVGISVIYLLSPGTLLALMISFGVVGVVLTFALHDGYWESSWPDRVRTAARGGCIGGLAAGGFAGHAVLLGAGVFLLGLAVLSASPAVVRRYVRWVHAAPRTTLDEVARALAYGVPELAALPLPPPPPELPTEDGELRILSDEQLCQQWRASYSAVRAAHGAEDRARVVQNRQRVLDELDRRHGVGFAAWLASSPRSAGNPLPYLQGRRSSRHRIDWDGLITGQDL